MSASVASLLQPGIASDLKWKVLLAVDFSRVEMLSAVAFDQLSEEGRAEASRAGYSTGDSVTIQLRAERDGAREFHVLSKDDPPSIHWVTRVRKEVPRPATGTAKTGGGCLVAIAALVVIAVVLS